MRTLVAVTCALLCACANSPAPKLDRGMKPEGERWFCSTEASGMLSVCERTKKKCKRARRYLSKLSHRRGDQMTLGKCVKQTRAHCLTAERKIPKEPPEEGEEAEDEGDEEQEAGSSEEADAEASESSEPDRFVLEDTIWLCYATPDNCEEQRKNMYYFGFTHVSRCGRWK